MNNFVIVCIAIVLQVFLTPSCATLVNLETCKLSCESDSSSPTTVPSGCSEATRLQQTVDRLSERLNQLENPNIPRSCADVTPKISTSKSGVFTIYPFKIKCEPLEVLCDHHTHGGGWLVFQKRMDGSENFTRGWDDYARGFGSLTGEFWLGLEKIHRITTDGKYELRVDMEDFEGTKKYAHYSNFSVGHARSYSLNITKPPSGNAGDGMQPTGTKFSTYDMDQDNNPGYDCATSFKGGGWFSNCHTGHPNGLYLGGPHLSYADGVNWLSFRGWYYSLKSIQMKIRKIVD